MASNEVASTPPAQIILRHVSDEALDSIADGSFTVDADRVLRSFSRKLERLTGIAAHDAIGRPCREVLGGSTCDDECPMTWSLEHAATVERHREQFELPDGRVVPVVLTTAILQDAAGRTTAVAGIVRADGELERAAGEPDDRDIGHGAPPRSDSDRLRHALDANHWNESKTARALGISRTTLWRRMRRYRLVK